ncbi:MFS transporter [Novosphingobium sp. Gsoil 351]|uniref:POT-type proton-dependent oligopeptide transporter n=1 Tax=Novosphingobium sp. Gsoil 351 TaxID=2675225 RepID=UPI0018A83EAB|nr:MFS transporter [Novosphingobium sp. Gsoil 351]
MSDAATFARTAVVRLSAIEFWERYSYYTTFTLLALFASAPVASGGLGWSAPQSLRFFGVYLLAVQVTPIVGGWAADRVIGMGRSLRLGAAALVAGHSLLAVAATLPWLVLGDGFRLLDHVAGAGLTMATFDPAGLKGAAATRYLLLSMCFYLGVAAIALGNGLFKPILTVIVGRLPHPDAAARTAAFTTFFLYINIGGLLSVLLGGWLAQNYGWAWAFAGSAMGMAIAIVTALALNDRYISPFTERGGMAHDDTRDPSADDKPFVISVALLLALLVLCSTFSFQSYGFVSLFTARFVARDVSGFVIPPAWFTALNPITIMILTPLLLRWWKRGGPGSSWSTVQHIAAALLLMAIGFLPLVAAARTTAEKGLASPLWVAASIMAIAASELLYSPAGMAASTRLAPARYATLAIGSQGAAIGLGAWLSGQLGAVAFEGDKASVMGMIALATSLAGGALLLGRRMFARFDL